MRRAPAVVVLLLAVLGLATAALWLAKASLAHLVTVPSPRAGAANAQTVTPGGDRRIVLAMIDGLGVREARQVPFLERVARQGAFLVATGPDPAWPVPAWATILTGTDPATHRALWPAQPRSATPGLIDAFRAQRLSIAATGSRLFLNAVGAEVNLSFPVLPDTPPADAIHQAMATRSSLTLVHLDMLHPVDHRLSTRPRRDLLADLDTALAAVAAEVNPTRDTIAVVGSFVTDTAGSHGDGTRQVPLILSGAGVRGGTLGRADLRDIAPTLAALFPVRQLDTASGQVLGEYLSVPTTAAKPTPAEPARGAGPGWPTWTELQLRWQVIQGHWLGLTGATLGALLYLCILLTRPAFGRQVLVSVILYLAVYHVAFFLGGGQFGPELAHLDELGWTFWRQRGIPVVVGMAISALYIGIACGRRGARRGGLAAVMALHTIAAILMLLGLQAIPAVLWAGWPPAPTQLGMGWAVKYFLDLMQAVLLGYGAPVWVVVAWVGYAAVAGGGGPARSATLAPGPSHSERPALRVLNPRRSYSGRR